jgi:glucose-1-phosphate adenylyltransferase
MEVPWEEASRFGIMNADENDRIYEFEEKPANPKSNLASMGIYIFTWSKLREALIADNKVHDNSDFGMHIIPLLLNNGGTLYAYRFKSYWKDVGTIESYWAANMDLIKTLPEFNLYEDFWKIYTNNDYQPPNYIGASGEVTTSIISEGCRIYGKVEHSVISKNVVIEEGAYVKDSIIMENCVIKAGAVLDRVIVDQNTVIGNNVNIGGGENVPNEAKPKIYNTGITVIGSDTTVPDNVQIGKNCVVYGPSKAENYPDGKLASGQSVIIEEGRIK